MPCGLERQETTKPCVTGLHRVPWCDGIWCDPSLAETVSVKGRAIIRIADYRMPIRQIVRQPW
jgi:hypothetical protein